MKSITQILYSVISFLGLYKDPKEAKFKKLASHKCIEMKKWRYAPLFEYFTEQYEDHAFRVFVDMVVGIYARNLKFPPRSNLNISEPAQVLTHVLYAFADLRSDPGEAVLMHARTKIFTPLAQGQ
ncbi:hypothetical protein BD769DRAFT_1661822 [Suillus cothurnatus]|nr:hypothetical protein BD769DRAFT_1679424 [Suillus cothurnatus]KAG2094272.1 hypothetical protein BD769DRAFT_1678688 [Suillus cothurnatus]KAG2142497.1 hypothetical protein BD769DRAFT_1661822 [Suillus cothurnatus]